MKTRLRFAWCLVALVAAPVSAGSRTCNATLVAQNVCRAGTNQVLFYDAPAAALAELRDAILAEHDYRAQVVCATARQFRPLLNGAPSKIVAAAGEVTDSCTVGAMVANPQTASAFADAVIDMELRNRVIRHKHAQAVAAVPGLETIPTPDVGP